MNKPIMAQGPDPESGSVSLSSLLIESSSCQEFAQRAGDYTLPSPKVPSPKSSSVSPKDLLSSCLDDQSSPTDQEKKDPDWDGDTETEVSETETETETESETEDETADDKEAVKVNEGEKYVPEFVNSTESQESTSHEVCSQVVSDLLSDIFPDPESKNGPLDSQSNCAPSKSVDDSLDSVPDFLDFLEFPPESSQSATENKDENQGKKKKKRKRKRDESEKGKKRKREPGEKRRKKAKKEDGDKKHDKHERKNIRKIIADDNLDEETRNAQQLELERKKRLHELQKNVQNNVHLKALLQSSDEEEEKKEEEKTKSKDVVTISSSDDDDDVVMLDEKKKAAESDSEDDPNDAGCHVNDMLNVPDDDGRVLVNVGHPKEDPDIFVNERLAKLLKPHQVGGIRFLYDNLVESLDHFKASNGFGCVLAHSMGLGKTIQIVTFVDVFLRNTSAKYVLCIVPINTLQNWMHEFNMWLPTDPAKAPQPPVKKEKKEVKQEKQEPDPFGLNFMNYPWMNSSYSAPQMNWNSFYGNEWMQNSSLMGGNSMNSMSQQMQYPNYGSQYPVKQEYFGQDYQQYPYNDCSQYGQYSQDYNYANQYMYKDNYLNGPTSEVPKFPPLTPPPESGVSNGVGMMGGPMSAMGTNRNGPMGAGGSMYPNSMSRSGPMGMSMGSGSNAIGRSGMGSTPNPMNPNPMNNGVNILGANPISGGPSSMGSVPNPMSSGPNPMSSGPNPMGAGSNIMGSNPNTLGAVPNPMSSGSNSMGSNPIGNIPNPMTTCPNSMASASNSVDSGRTSMSSTPTAMGNGSGASACPMDTGSNSFNTGPSSANTGQSVPCTANASNPPSTSTESKPSSTTTSSTPIKTEPGVKTEPGAEVKQEKAEGAEGKKEEEERKTAIDPKLADTPWRPFEVYVLSDNHKNMVARSKVVGEWKKTGGVLLMGYEMYRLLATRKPRKRPPKKTESKKVIDVDQEDKDNELAIDIQAALLKPGPDLVICDEGHRIKNSHAGISQALKNIKTRRRVVLTGYPLQNNLLEYWCMVDFVRPNFLGTKSEFSNMFERPIMNGQCHDSTAADCKLMRYRAHVLHSLLEGFVQRRGHTVLRAALPAKTEYVVLVKMSAIQRKLYTTFMQRVNDAEVAEWATTNPIKAFSVMCKIWNHPDILFKLVKRLKDENVDDDLDLADENGKPEEEGAKKRAPRKSRAGKKKGPEGEEGEEKEPEVKGNVGNTISYEWAQELMTSYVPGDLTNGGKMLCMFSIMEESIAIGDKILIFSQSLFTLNLIEEFLSQAYVPVPGCQEKWTKNRHYYRLDGATSATDREKMVNNFNNPDNQLAWLFLLSTRAGCLGINLTGANRVIVYDASWNPCHDCQAVCRVYRYGQTKPCFIYRLVSDNTMEKKIYDRQVSKQTISDRVVDELNPQNRISRKQMEDLLDYQDMDQATLEVNDELLDKYDDPVVQSLLRNNGDIITKDPFTHESLLIDQKDYKLSKAEKNMARLSYEREKKMSAYGGYTRPSYANYYPKSGNNLITGIPGSSLVINRNLSTPLPRMAGTKPVDGKAGGNAGVTVHQIITTTDIVVPGSGKDPKSQYKIPAGQQVLVIKTPRGVYIRTPEGKIFAVRTTGKLGNETGLPGLGTPVSGASTSTSTASSVPLTAGNSVGKSLLTSKLGGSLPTAPRILGSIRRRPAPTPNLRLANQRSMAKAATPTQSVITLDDSDSEATDDNKSDADKLVTVEPKRGQISLIKPIGGLNDPPPKSVKVIMKPPTKPSGDAKSPMTSLLKKSPSGSPARSESDEEKTITLVRPPGKKPAPRTQIFLSRSSDHDGEEAKLTLVTQPSTVAPTTTASVVASASSTVSTSTTSTLSSSVETTMASTVSKPIVSEAEKSVTEPTSKPCNKQFEPMTDVLTSTSSVPAFTQPYQSQSTATTTVAPPAASRADNSSRLLPSGGTMTEQKQQKTMNWMLPDEKSLPLPSFSMERPEAKNPLEGMMSMSFNNAWSNPYQTPVTQPLQPWSGMDSQFSEKKRRDPFYSQTQDYRYNYPPQVDFYNTPYYHQSSQYSNYHNYSNARNFSGSGSSYYNSQMFPQAAGDFQQRYPNSLESMASYESASADGNSLKWQTAFTHAQTSSTNSYPSQRSVPDLPDLSSLGEF